VVADHVSFAALDSTADVNFAFNTSQQAWSSVPGFCSTADQVVVELEVTAQVDQDVRELDSRQYSQFLLRFDGLTDLDADSDRAVFDRELLELQVDVLVP
jgi:hypothetical protein